jgi:Family of unknown function (DUF6444)
VERVEAEAIYDQGREVVVEVLLRMDRQIQELSAGLSSARADLKAGGAIAQLERWLNRSSRNSSQPPSADGPSVSPRRSKDSSGRHQGAQPGHDGKGGVRCCGRGLWMR